MKAYRRQRRPGSIAIFSLVLMVSMMAFVAFAVDIGCLAVSRTELQRSADAASVAAAWQLIDEGGWSGSPVTCATAARYASLNKVSRLGMGLGAEDIDIGHLENPSNPSDSITHGDVSKYNAVEVCVRRTDGMNGEVPLFFARVLGQDSLAAEGEATAAFLNNIAGFHIPKGPHDGNVPILPFALDEETWEATNNPIDDWKWDAGSGEDGEVLEGPDGCFEMNLFPQGTGAAGNRGTVDIGSLNNSTADISRQIVDGINGPDLAHHGGELKISAESFELILNGDTGISDAVKDELDLIRGEIRCIPIFREVKNPGNNAEYTIVKWVGVRIMKVKLTGPMKKKELIVQPAKLICRGTIPAPEGGPQMSDLVYSPPWIVR